MDGVVRVCVQVPSVTGTMSRRLGGASSAKAASVTRSITALPATIALTSLRDLAWPMAQILERGVRLNLISLEALAAAEVHDAQLCLAAIDENPQLLHARLLGARPPASSEAELELPLDDGGWLGQAVSLAVNALEGRKRH